MTEKEEKLRKFVDQYDIAVPQDRVEQELRLIRIDTYAPDALRPWPGRNYPFPAIGWKNRK